MLNVRKYFKQLIRDVKKIISNSIKAWEQIERTETLIRASRTARKEYRNDINADYEREKLRSSINSFLNQIEKIDKEDLSLISSENLSEFSKQIIEELQAILNLVNSAKQAINERNYSGLKDYFGAIINLGRAELREVKETKKSFIKIFKAPLYHGTTLGSVWFSLLYNNGDFGAKETFFYLKEKDAEVYANNNINNLVLNKKDILEEKRKLFEEGIVLEFDHEKIGEAQFNNFIEEGRAEFIVNHPVNLNSLTDKSKKEIIKRLNLKKEDEEYKNLF